MVPDQHIPHGYRANRAELADRADRDDHPRWMRVMLRAASRHATAEELGDVMEEYASSSG